MVLPLLAWVGTGVVFHWKPGWGAAFAIPELPRLPIEAEALPRLPTLSPPPDSLTWVRTPIGLHLIARTPTGSVQLDPSNGRVRTPPPADTTAPLFEALRRSDPSRFGDRAGPITLVDGRYRYEASTGVTVILAWNDLSLSQSGPDTERIDTLYRIHYLQWSGHPTFDRPFALLGLFLLFALAVSGLRLAFRRS